MAKYGEFYWGNGTLYGATATPVYTAPTAALITWIVHIDWTGGGYSGTNEASRLKGYKLNRGRQALLAYGASSFESIRPGTISLTLDNHDGRYNSLWPGKRIKVEAQSHTTGKHTRFVGIIDDVQPVSWPDKSVVITASDALKKLQTWQLTDYIPLQDTTISEAIQDILTYQSWDAGMNIQPWDQPIVVFDPTGPLTPAVSGTQTQDPTQIKQANGQTVLDDLANASLGTIFVNKKGQICFYPINYNGMSSYSLTQSQLLKEIKTTAPLESYRNFVTMESVARSKTAVMPIWYTGNPIAVPPYSFPTFQSFKISFQSSCDVVTTLVRDTDFFYGVNSDGSGGTNPYAISIWLTDVTPTTAVVNIDPIITGGGLAWLQVRGCNNAQSTYTATAGNASAIDRVDFYIKSPWLQDQGYMNALVALLYGFLSTTPRNPIVQLRGQPTIQYDYDLFDHVSLSVGALGISDTYSVGGIDEEWQDETGQDVKTTLYLQKMLYSTDTITPQPLPPGVPAVSQNSQVANTTSGMTWGISLVIGDGDKINTGTCAFIQVPFNCQITGCELVGDAAGALILDIWRTTYGGFPTSNSICSNGPPSLASSNKSIASVFGWTTNLNQGDWLTVIVMSVANVKLATLALSGVTL